MDKNLEWFKSFRQSSNYSTFEKNPIAFFCAEYALTSGLPIYAGGLGVLAGDYLREAQEQNFPVVALGMYYYDGYQTLHQVDEKGAIQTPHVHVPPEDYGLVEVKNEKGELVLIDVPIQDRSIKVKAWKWNVGSVPVYLLDTNTESNSEADRKITNHLYVIDRETRLKQALVLGVGGVRLLEALGITPSIYHMNEGFSSFLCLELIKRIMQDKKVNFEDAKNAAKQKIVFTNHTLVTAGHDIYPGELMNINFVKYTAELGIPMTEIMNLGSAQDSSSFSSSLFALRMAGKVNAVSKIHAKKSLELWPNNPMTPITNGINIKYWNKVSSENDIWAIHLENKRELLKEVNILTEENWDENMLLVGWARRLVEYKRPLALFENIERLKAIVSNSNKPVKILISGTQHPSDMEAVEFFKKIREIIDNELKGSVVFLPGYNLALSRLMASSCDVWLNTPIVGFEACGTSGMKAALNGDLPLSTKDGWMDEVDFYGIGWPLDTDKVNESILGTLEAEIIPLYFNRDSNNVPTLWIENMKRARNLILSEFSTTRMLKEYIELLYTPLVSSQ
ncbi:MAG TPA: alpha-glucan family phosphorylase [Patescibacteria group bacterium]|nr:alpha-glucan family phosphorylase [Patescibacteria group bacterium]